MTSAPRDGSETTAERPSSVEGRGQRAYDVVSLGSVNVDHVGYLSDDAIAALEREYDWFPNPGETVAVDAVPTALCDRLTEVSLGGKGANQAVAAARAGADTAFLGAVGDDDDRYGVRAGIAAHGVDVGEVERTTGPTGSAYVVVDETAENRIAILSGANATVDREYVQAQVEAVHGAACLLLQNEIPTDGARRLLDRLADDSGSGADPGRGGDAATPLVVLNPAPARGAEPLMRHPAVDLIVANEPERAHLADPLEAFEGTLVVTRGPDPVQVTDPAMGEFEVVPPTVDAVDTTGAGDVFVGYLAAMLATGSDLWTAVERAVVAASLSTETTGVHLAVPDASTVDARR